jgi:hypothetical protein
MRDSSCSANVPEAVNSDVIKISWRLIRYRGGWQTRGSPSRRDAGTDGSSLFGRTVWRALKTGGLHKQTGEIRISRRRAGSGDWGLTLRKNDAGPNIQPVGKCDFGRINKWTWQL